MGTPRAVNPPVAARDARKFRLRMLFFRCCDALERGKTIGP